MSKRKRESASPVRDGDSAGVDVVVSAKRRDLDSLDMYTYKISIKQLLVSLLTTELGLERVSAKEDTNEDYIFVKIAVKNKESSDSGSDAVPFSPRRSFTRKAPKLSRVASKVQTFLRTSLGLSDFLVDIDTQDD